MATSSCRVSVVIDMSFDDLMTEKDKGKAYKQIIHCYSINRRLENPMQFHVTGLKVARECGAVFCQNTHARKMLSFQGSGEAEMSKHDGYKNWDVHFHSGNYDSVLPKEKIVYLSSESDNILERLDEEKFYVIGGLVDHNAHKGLERCLQIVLYAITFF
jgi:tRNA (guanine9-N1)-methyltransferase